MVKMTIKREKEHERGPKPRDIEYEIVEECWRVTNLATIGDYTIVKYKGRAVLATRYFWAVIAGKSLSRRDTLQHTCGNSWCVNPEHLKIMEANDVFDETY